MTRAQTVRALRLQASQCFNVDVYRIAMASDAGSLELDSVSLEARGVTQAGAEISVRIEDEQLMRMATSDLLERAVQVGLASRKAAAAAQGRLKKNPEEEASVRARYLPRLQVLEAKARAAKIEEGIAEAEDEGLRLEKQRLEEEKEEWLVRLAQMKDATSRPRRIEPLAGLTLVDLHRQAVEAGVLRETSIVDLHRQAVDLHRQAVETGSGLPAASGSGGLEYRTMLMEHVGGRHAMCQWSAEASRLRDTVEAAADIAQQELRDSTQMKYSAEQYLGQAAPALREADTALRTISKCDFTEASGLKSAPKALLKTLEAVCVLLRWPLRADTADARWQIARSTVLKDSNLLNRLITYDKDNIDDDTIRRLEPFITNEEFHPDRCRRSSKLAAVLCTWVRAISVYHSVFQFVKPQFAAVRKIEAWLKVRNAVVASRRSQLEQAEECLELLRSELAGYAPLSPPPDDALRAVDPRPTLSPPAPGFSANPAAPEPPPAAACVVIEDEPAVHFPSPATVCGTVLAAVHASGPMWSPAVATR